jgi:hypothetical protein
MASSTRGREGSAPLPGGARRTALLAALAAAGAAAAPAAAQPAAGSIVLAPHRAIYEISLGEARGGSGITDLTGRMVYEITGNACEGHTQSMRFVTRMTSQEGTGTITDLRTSSHEDGPARKLRFSSTQYRDDKLAEQTVGDAERGADAISVDITRPEKKSLKHKPDALFPIQHSIRLLEEARAGRAVFVTDLYDGSEKGEKVYATTALIGRRHPPGHNRTLPAAKNAQSLDALAAWPISMSYFEQGKDLSDATPNYELAFLFFENGVSRRLYIDYGEFSIRGELTELTYLDQTKCEPKTR